MQSQLRSQLKYSGSELDIDGPICSLPVRLLKPLCAKLALDISVDVDGHGGNWRDLAGHIGLPMAMIELIESFKDRTKPHTLFKIWDEGISRNPGSIRKLIIALFELGISYLEDDLLIPLMGSTVIGAALNDYVESLKQSLKEPIFPCLDLNDIVWDEEMERHITRSDSVCSSWSTLPTQIQTDDRCIYVSYYTRSRSRTYTREVKSIINYFEQHHYTVFNSGHSTDLQARKESLIRQSANIIVVFNKEYLRAHEVFKNNEMLPSCLAVDIPLISHIFNNVPGGRSRIIPVVIDRCKTQPPLSSFPVYLTGTTRKFYPKDARALLACIQKIPLQVVLPPPGIRTIKQDVFNSDEIRRKYKESKSTSS